MIYIIFLLLLGVYLINYLKNKQIEDFICNTNYSKLDIVTLEEGKKLISIGDEYTKNLSKFDLQSKTESLNNSISEDDYLKYASKQVLKWSRGERETLKNYFKIFCRKLDSLNVKISFPAEIKCIKTTMKEEGNAEGYTRGNCIFIKNASYKLFVHELFHILSKHNSTISKKVYNVFDFDTNFKVIYPIEIKPYLISNPDTPLNVCTKISYDDEIVEVIPIIYSTINYEGGSFFDYMNLGLLIVKNINKNGINYKISKRDVNNNPKIVNVTDSKIPKNKKRLDMINNINISNNSTHEFQEMNLVNNFKNKMGKNTGYNIHPEETSAEHFTFLVTRNDWKDTLPQPEYVEKLLKILRNQPIDENF